MTGQTVLPSAERIGNALGGILMRRVTAQPCAAVKWGKDVPGALGVYQADDGGAAAWAVHDLPLCVFEGGALVLEPKNRLADALKTGKLPEALMENVREVMNICAQLFNDPGRAHVALKQFSTDVKQAVAAVQALAGATRIDLQVSIADYGSGRLTIFV